MRITKFEEVEAWIKARKLTKHIYQQTRADQFAKDFGLSGQIQRASVSIMSNIAEGFDSGSKLEFIRFLGYAKRSASEVQCHLYAVLDQRYISEDDFSKTYEQVEITRKLISAFIRYLRNATTTQPANRLTGQLA